MFDFLLDNPVFLFAALFALYRFFKGKKAAADPKTAQKTPSSAGEEALARAKARQAAKPTVATSMTLEQRIEALAREFEQKSGIPSGLTQRSELGQQPISAGGEVLVHDAPLTGPKTTGRFSGGSIGQPSLESTSLERGSIESGSLEAEPFEADSSRAFVIERNVPSARIDYDLDAKAFDYHTAIEEPDAKKFHLDSFAGFHSASGVRTATAEVESIGGDRSVFEDMLGTKEDLQRAFVLTEVLSRPLSLRGSGATRPR